MTIRTPERCAGLFVPIFALRSGADLGVGDTESLREMIDWCAEQGFRVLQVLPINETSDDNSPYNAISSLALDITTLALLPGSTPGLSEAAFNRLANPEMLKSLHTGPVQYRIVKALKWSLCEDAFAGFLGSIPDALHGEFESFLTKERHWLGHYAFFRALVEHNGHPAWEQWPEPQRTPQSAELWMAGLDVTERNRFSTRLRFYSFVQWLLYRQWESVAAYAEAKSVRLMGDMPFGVSRHSADVWSNPEQFDLKWSGGAPPEPMFQPDSFTAKWGQNWGVPIYRWDRMEEDGYTWWKRRVQGVVRIFKLFRIDHVLGFYRVFSFPWQPQENALYAELGADEAREKAGDLPRFLPNDDTTPLGCQSNCMHGESILWMLSEAAGDSVIVAEDLGVVPDYVRPSLLKLGISGFKIPVFERIEHSREYKNPKEYPELTIATLSTHDHETMFGTWEAWWRPIERDLGVGRVPSGDAGLSEEAKQASWELYRTQRFCGLSDAALIRDFEPLIREALVKTLLECRSWLAVLTITDLFGLKTRFNVPGPVAESNWSERLPFKVSELNSNPFYARVGAFTHLQMKSCGR